MAKLGLDELGVSALVDHQGGCGVSKLVDLQTRESGSFYRWCPLPASEVRVAKRPALRRREDEAIGGDGGFLEVVPELVTDRCGHRDDPLAIGFGGPEMELTGHLGERLADMQP